MISDLDSGNPSQDTLHNKAQDDAWWVKVRIQMHILDDANHIWQAPEPKEIVMQKDKDKKKEKA